MILSKISCPELSRRVCRILRASARPLLILPSKFSAGFLVWILALILTSCSSMRRVQTIPVETIKEVTRIDTLYINNVQYDSIYISQDRYTDRSKDTILIHQHDVEYRYKLLRDTIERIKFDIRHDSIPYEVRITEIKEVKYIPPWIKTFAIIGIITILVFLIYTITKLKRF